MPRTTDGRRQRSPVVRLVRSGNWSPGAISTPLPDGGRRAARALAAAFDVPESTALAFVQRERLRELNRFPADRGWRRYIDEHTAWRWLSLLAIGPRVELLEADGSGLLHSGPRLEVLEP